MSLPRQSTAWDDKRNTSRVFLVAPDALPKALSALRRLRETDPALVAWIEDGHPTLTEEQHVARFGGRYERTRSRKAVVA